MALGCVDRQSRETKFVPFDPMKLFYFWIRGVANWPDCLLCWRDFTMTRVAKEWSSTCWLSRSLHWRLRRGWFRLPATSTALSSGWVRSSVATSARRRCRRNAEAQWSRSDRFALLLQVYKGGTGHPPGPAFSMRCRLGWEEVSGRRYKSLCGHFCCPAFSCDAFSVNP